MLTPQQIDEVTLDTAVFGGYDTKSVDAFLEPLIEDYVTLYKENALLKSKMRVLVDKVEEYRNKEAELQEALDNAQKTCDRMILEAQAKCDQMVSDAKKAPAQAKSSPEFEKQISELQLQMQSWVVALDLLKGGDTKVVPTRQTTDAMAAEIAANLQNLIGTPEEPVAASLQTNSHRKRGK